MCSVIVTKQQFVLHNNSYAYALSETDDPAKENYISTWSEVTDVLSRRIYRHPMGDVIVSANWDEAKSVSIASLDGTFNEDRRYDVFKENFQVPVVCTVVKPESVKASERHFLELFLYDFFLCLNLSAPGSCDFFSAYIDPPQGKRSDMKLSASLFEGLWMRDVKANWGLINRVPLRQVVQWFDSLDLGTRQIAASRMERSLFALLHLCHLDGAEPSDLVWLAHILEALYDTPKETITKSLQDRVCAVLSIPEEKKKPIRKQLRDFYDARSKFVHGEFAVTHPLSNDFLDEEAHKLQGFILGTTDFGAAVCIATLQKHIVDNWREINFREIHQGAPV